MTFDLGPSQLERLRAVRELAESLLAPVASEIDRTGEVPEAIAREIARLDVWGHGPLDAVLVIEELAAASASVAALAVLGDAAADRGASLAGLRGVAPVAEPTETQRLGIAAVSVGIGRAAVAAAVAELKRTAARPMGEPHEAPHWVLSDAATEIDAARLLVHAAATDGCAASAQVFAGNAAVHAAEAAVRILGVDADRPGALAERLGRDARAARLVAGVEDAVRRVAADVVLGSKP